MPEDPPSPAPCLIDGAVDYKDSPQFQDELFEEEEEEGEYEDEEEEDPEEDENYMEVENTPVCVNHNYVFPEEEKIDTTAAVVFTDADIEAFIGEPLTNADEPKFHSALSVSSNNNCSAPSSSSVVRKMDALGMDPSDATNSHSGKRKVKDGTIDTASSVPIGNKKPRFDV